MQTARVDFYNPLSQGIVKLTDPALKPMRRFIPRIAGFDLSALTLALFVQLVALTLVVLMKHGIIPNPMLLIAWAMLGLFSLTLKIYFFALLVMVIVSWIAPYSQHPVISLIYQLCDPICAPARKLVPPMGGLDFSIILVFVLITLIDSYLVVTPLQQLLNVPSRYLLGF
jgi:YggT family protein